MVMLVDADSNKEEDEETGTNLLSFDKYLLRAIFQHILISIKSGVKGSSDVPLDQIVANLKLKVYKALQVSVLVG